MKTDRQIKRDLLHFLNGLGLKSGCHRDALTKEDFDALTKALSAGYGQANSIFVSPLKAESLEATLRQIVFSDN